MSKIKTIIGICGGSGSGKTSLVKKLCQVYDPSDIEVLSMDDYYKQYEQQKLDSNGIVNFDLPEAIEYDRIVADIIKLKEGESVTIEEYTFNNPNISAQEKTMNPSRILIIEGIFLLFVKQILEQLDFAVYIEVNPEVQLNRRVERDINQRGYSKDQIIYQWENHVMPCFDEYIKPFIYKADIVIDNNAKGELNIQPIVDKIELETA